MGNIFRVKKNKENPYVMLNKKFLNRKDLSLKAKGLLTYLLSKPDDWETYQKEIEKNCSDGLSSISSGIKELVEKKYIRQFRLRNDKGHFKGWAYLVYETPEESAKGEVEEVKIDENGEIIEIIGNSPKPENPNSGNPNSDNPESDFPNSENRFLLNNESNNKTEEEDARTRDISINPKIKAKYEEIFQRKFSSEMYKKILELYSDEKIVMKALKVTEENGDKPSYLLKLLSDWQENELTSISSINTYLENRQAQNSNNHQYKQHIKDKNIEEMKENGWK